MFLRQCVLLGLSAVWAIACTVVTAQETPSFKHVIPTDSVRFTSAFSGDSQVGAMVFDNLIVETEIGRGSLPSVRTKQFSYVLQPESQADVTITQLLRGFVNTQGTGNATMIVHSGGRATLVDWEKAITAAKNPAGKKFVEAEKKPRKSTSEQRIKQDYAGRFDDFMVELKMPVAVGKPLQTTVVLLVDRLAGDDESGAMIMIDSIDFETRSALKPKKN